MMVLGGIVDRETVERRMDAGQIGGVSSVPADTWPITPSNSVEKPGSTCPREIVDPYP